VPRLSPQHALARRALTEDLQQHKRGWLQHGIAALAVSVLGVGVAASMMVTGAAQQQSTPQVATAAVQTSVQAGVTQPTQFDSRQEQVTRSARRQALSPEKVSGLAAERAAGLGQAGAALSKSSAAKAVQAREKKLKAKSKASLKVAARLKAQRALAEQGAAAAATSGTAAAAAQIGTQGTTTGKAALPVAGGYTIAARFGQVGSWSRYHTGFDFAAPVGSPLEATTAGVVTNAGSGPASGWAGNYVTIKHGDGTSTLYAHMSTVSVSVGQSVSGGQQVGAVGMTGRTFGPHLHFEVYPAGVEPGDVYRAVNPEPWLAGLGLHP
jgi:murein DD-endopeptidase MepM/ murein hydrolase activator NlpD